MTTPLTKKHLLLVACREPKRFTDLLEEVGMSKNWLNQALKELESEGLIRKLPDGRYVVTEEGRVLAEKLAEEVEVFELVKKAVRLYGAEAVKQKIQELLQKTISQVVAETEFAGTLVRLLRVWATVTGCWLISMPKPEMPSPEEKARELEAVEKVARVLAALRGERWWAHFKTMIPEAKLMERYYEKGVNPVLALAPWAVEGEPRELAEKARGILDTLRPGGVSVLGTDLKDDAVYLLGLIERRLRELEARSFPPCAQNPSAVLEEERRRQMARWLEELEKSAEEGRPPRVSISTFSTWRSFLYSEPFLFYETESCSPRSALFCYLSRKGEEVF
jgi:DNA-binding HxlR family transcriptional regulator